MLAYILIIVEPGSEKEVASALLKKKEVKNIHVIFGEYDIIANVDVENEKALNDFVYGFVRKLKSVERTATLVVAD